MIRELGTLAEERERARPGADLWENPIFQDWVKGTREELNALKELPWGLGAGRLAGPHAVILESCGLRLPTSSQELYECFTAVKAVVHYAERKLQELEARTKRFYTLLEKERELEREK